MDNNNLSHALTYARSGFRVAPIEPGKKWPCITAWQDNATVDVLQITEWWTRWPDYGVSIVLDHPYFVVDVDPRHGGDDTLHELMVAHQYDYPITVLSVTGGGGEHHVLRNPTHIPIPNGSLGPGIDVRGVGGQIVAPPTIHPNGQPYMWEEGHELGEFPVADAPRWVIDALTVVADPEPRRERSPRPEGAAPQPGEVFAATHTWPELLEADGWALASRHRDGWEAWRGPHHGEHEGTSATLYYGGSDVLKVFTPSVPGLKLNETYTKFGYLTATRYDGDFGAATRALGKELDEMYAQMLTANAGQTLPPAEPTEPGAYVWELVDWSKISTSEDDLVEGLVIPGRWLQVVTAAKGGKSSLLMWIAINLSTGRHPWDGHEIEPQRVLYCDGEMGYSDVRSLIVDCGFDPTQLPNLYASVYRGRLDTIEGAYHLHELVDGIKAQVVILDGLNGFLAAEASENDSQTWRPVYQYTVVPMKDQGIAILSGDNMGKKPELGSRGSSAKNDKADGVLNLKITDEGVRLHISHNRAGAFLADDLDLNAEGFDRTTPIRYWRSTMSWPAGTREVADLLDRLGVEMADGRNKVRARLKELAVEAEAAGTDASPYKVRDTVLTAAIRFRHQRPNLKIVPS